MIMAASRLKCQVTILITGVIINARISQWSSLDLMMALAFRYTNEVTKGTKRM